MQQIKYYERVKELSTTSDEFALKFVKEGGGGKYEIAEKRFQRRKITVNQRNKVEQMQPLCLK